LPAPTVRFRRRPVGYLDVRAPTLADERKVTVSLEMHPCPHCPAEFDSLKSLEHHIKASHHEDLPNEKFRCSTCDDAFMKQVEWL
jgi:hypothetical protein